MVPNVKKVPPLTKGFKRPERPYPKNDITVEDQKREKKKLLRAGVAFAGYSERDLTIIAMSYEHKCFIEANNREEYIASIRKKLDEWQYVPTEEEDKGLPIDGPLHPTTKLSGKQNGFVHQHQQGLKQARNNHQRHRSGPPQPVLPNTPHRGPPAIQPATAPAKEILARSGQFSQVPTQAIAASIAYQQSIPQSHNPQYRNQLMHQSQDQFGQRLQNPTSQLPSYSFANGLPSPNGTRHPGAPFSVGYSPTLESRKTNGSPKSQPMSHTTTTMSDSSSNASSHDTFVDFLDPNYIFNPEVLGTLDLNDPETRAHWIGWVWEYFRSGGQWNGYTSTAAGWPDSQGNSPVPLYSSTTANGYNSMTGTDANRDLGAPLRDVRKGSSGAQDVDMVGTLVSYSCRESRGTSNNGRRHSEDPAGLANGGFHRNGGMNGESQWITSDYQMDMTGGMDGIMDGTSQKWMVL